MDFQFWRFLYKELIATIYEVIYSSNNLYKTLEFCNENCLYFSRVIFFFLSCYSFYKDRFLAACRRKKRIQRDTNSNQLLLFMPSSFYQAAIQIKARNLHQETWLKINNTTLSISMNATLRCCYFIYISSICFCFCFFNVWDDE